MKQKILLTFLESGFGHISSMESVYDALVGGYSDIYDIEKSYIMRDDGFKHLMWMENFLTSQVKNTNKIPGFGKFIFPFINVLGGRRLLRFFNTKMCRRSFKEGLEALRRRDPTVIVTNHYFTNILAIEYKRRIDADVIIVNYNPDNTLHKIWDNRDGIFVVNNKESFERALKLGFKEQNLRCVNPCVREAVASNKLTKNELRDKYALPRDKFTVTLSDGGYMIGRGPKYARKLIKSGLPITLAVVTGKNEALYDELTAINEGRGKIKLAEGMTLVPIKFTPSAFELYGAADVLITKGGPNCVLDSVYMHTPVIINHCPHVIEVATAKFFLDEHGCGERAFKCKKAISLIKEMINDRTRLEEYERNIEEFLRLGNGASDVAAIIHEEVEKRAKTEQQTVSAPEFFGKPAIELETAAFEDPAFADDGVGSPVK